ncbi:sugar ABC transporter substrate-binding protein [Carnobacterium sp.]|uniref:sugar ABC transporter substrate-binding protein n=1 Tax=Carnobacterium sp. TaxID=48221 RepID=UPI00388FB880
MNKWYKKTAVGVLTLASAGLLMACSSGSNESGDSASSDSVSFWYMGDGNEQIQPILDDFTEETGITVDIQSIPWASAHDKLLTAVASGDGPDVVQMGTTWMAEFVDAGALQDISSYIETEDTLNSENFFEGSVATTKFDDTYYAVPWYTETRALYYRTDLLEEVGYSQAPKDWEELTDAAMKLSERGDNMYGFQVDSNDQSAAFMFARQNGSELFNEDKKPVFNEAPFVETVDYLNTFIQNGSSPKQDLGLDISQTFGGEGIVPMFISGPWMINSINDSTTDIEGKWATAVLPSGSENNLSNTGGANLAVFNGTENEENAVALIEFLSRPENQLAFFESSNSLPSATIAWEDEALSDPIIAVFGEQLENSESMPLIPEFERIAASYLEDWEEIYLGGADSQEKMDEFNAETENLLQ